MDFFIVPFTDKSDSTITNYTNPLAPVRITFEPRPEILRENRTLTLISIGLNGHQYNTEVYDPLFNATIGEPYDFLDPSGGTYTKDRYRSGWVGRAMGCQEQVR
jgi:hypothetical protein